jgi:hypothetical protein
MGARRTVMTLLAGIAILAPLLVASSPAALAVRASPTVSWMDRTWGVTDGAMAGVAPGSPRNVVVDRHGFLHLRVRRTAAATTAAELFSASSLGFGTYQWQLEGAVDRMDPTTVLGLFPYGPAGGVGRDGEDELDIEFSAWDHTLCHGRCNADLTFYPNTGHLGLGPTERDFHIDLHGAHLVTARLRWSSTRVTGMVMSGLVPIGRIAHVLFEWTFAPKDYLARIPQQAVPVGMNLWCYEHVPESSQLVVVRSFQFESSRAASTSASR